MSCTSSEEYRTSMKNIYFSVIDPIWCALLSTDDKEILLECIEYRARNYDEALAKAAKFCLEHTGYKRTIISVYRKENK